MRVLFVVFIWLHLGARGFLHGVRKQSVHSSRMYPNSYRSRTISSMSPIMMSEGDLTQAFEVLDKYNDEYLSRMKSGRKEGLSPQAVEFQRIQLLGSDAIKKERETLRVAALRVSVSAEEVVLGIMTESVTNGINTLKKYVTGLNLKRGVLRAVDGNNDEIPIDSLHDAPVYLKYNSSDNGDVYMKAYDGGFVGVILQPRLEGEDFRQWGDLPLMLF